MQRFVVALLCAGFAQSHVSEARSAGKPVVQTIVIQGVKYEPDSLTVKRGSIVRWINKDPFPHTVTAQGFFDSHSIAAGGSWKYVAKKKGEITYACTLHPNMQARVLIQ